MEVDAGRRDGQHALLDIRTAGLSLCLHLKRQILTSHLLRAWRAGYLYSTRLRQLDVRRLHQDYYFRVPRTFLARLLANARDQLAPP